MDQFMVDISECKNMVRVGDEVTLLDSTFNADDMAQIINKIGYEIVCNISKRVPRIYIN